MGAGESRLLFWCFFTTTEQIYLLKHIEIFDPVSAVNLEIDHDEKY